MKKGHVIKVFEKNPSIFYNVEPQRGCFGEILRGQQHSIQNNSHVPIYDFHPSLNFVFSAIQTSWLNTDEESGLDEGNVNTVTQRKQEEVI